MQSYAEWINNKMYEGHVRRLTEIKQKQTTLYKTKTKFRIKSEPSKTSQQNPKTQFLPLSLVSKNQRLLLSEVIKGKSINLKQKQSLLENYLLSKRILQTNSVFDAKLLKKQYNFHKRVSDIMNRNHQINRRTFSELRKKKFSQLQKIKQSDYLGTGKTYFSLQIKQIILIKRRLQQNNQSTFNLIYKPERFKSYHIKSMTLTQLLSRKLNFRVSQKQLSFQNGLKFQLQQLRGNQIRKIAEFHLKFQILQSKEQKEQKQQKQQKKEKGGQNEKQNPELKSSSISLKQKIQTPSKFQASKNLVKQSKLIQKLIHPLTKQLIGTIQGVYQIHN